MSKSTYYQNLHGAPLTSPPGAKRDTVTQPATNALATKNTLDGTVDPPTLDALIKQAGGLKQYLESKDANYVRTFAAIEFKRSTIATDRGVIALEVLKGMVAHGEFQNTLREMGISPAKFRKNRERWNRFIETGRRTKKKVMAKVKTAPAIPPVVQAPVQAHGCEAEVYSGEDGSGLRCGDELCDDSEACQNEECDHLNEPVPCVYPATTLIEGKWYCELHAEREVDSVCPACQQPYLRKEAVGDQAIVYVHKEHREKYAHKPTLDNHCLTGKPGAEPCKECGEAYARKTWSPATHAYDFTHNEVWIGPVCTTGKFCPGKPPASALVEEPELGEYQITLTVGGKRSTSIKKKLREAFPDLLETDIEVEKLDGAESRADRLDSAVQNLQEVVEELKGELQEWRDNMPESLQESEKAVQLDEAIEALDNIASTIENLDEVEFPGMM